MLCKLYVADDQILCIRKEQNADWKDVHWLNIKYIYIRIILGEIGRIKRKS